MSEKLQTLKYVFTVEGKTERWYLEWLCNRINEYPDRKFNVSIETRVQQSPEKFYKSTTKKVTPEVTHICDVESNEDVHVRKFQKILSEMKDAKINKKISYELGYSNYTFELWMVLHKRNCNGPLGHRNQYLARQKEYIRDALYETYRRSNKSLELIVSYMLNDNLDGEEPIGYLRDSL